MLNGFSSTVSTPRALAALRSTRSCQPVKRIDRQLVPALAQGFHDGEAVALRLGSAIDDEVDEKHIDLFGADDLVDAIRGNGVYRIHPLCWAIRVMISPRTLIIDNEKFHENGQ